MKGFGTVFFTFLFYATTAHATTIHLLPFVDFLEPIVGQGCEISWKKLREHLEKVRPGPHKLLFYDINGMPNTAGVIAHYTRGEFKADDVLWFYYCGHGEMADGEHVLKMQGQGDLKRSEVRRMMEARKTKGVLITTDACAVQGTYVSVMPRGGGLWPPPAAEAWRRVESIVGGIEGTVDINAASELMPAFVDLGKQLYDAPPRGALFTNALLDLLQADPTLVDYDKSRTIEWDEAFVYLREGTRDNFQDLKESGELSLKQSAPGVTDQIPHAYSLGKNRRLRKGPVSFVRYRPTRKGARFLIQPATDGSPPARKLFVGIYFVDNNGQRISAISPQYHWEGVASVTKRVTEGESSLWELEIPREAYMPRDAYAEKFALVVVEENTKTYLHHQIYPLSSVP